MKDEPSRPEHMKKPQKISFKWQVLIMSVFVILLAQGFSTILGTLSYQQSYTESVISSNLVIASNFQHKLERALRFGKTIGSFYGINLLMGDVREINKHYRDVEVYLPDGSVLYSLDNTLEEHVPPANIAPDLMAILRKQQAVRTKGGYVLLYPVKVRTGEIVAIASVFLDNSVITDKLKEVVSSSVKMMSVLVLLAIFVLAVAIHYFVPTSPGQPLPKGRIFAILFSVMLVSQLVYSAISAHSLRNEYISLVHDEASKVTQQVKRDIEKEISKGVPLESLSKGDLMLDSVLNSAELIKTVMITDRANNPLITLNREREITSSTPVARAIGWLEALYTGNNYEKSFPLVEKTGAELRVVGHIRTIISREYIQNKLEAFLLDAMTVLVVALMLITEIMLFMQAFLQHQKQDHSTMNSPVVGHAFVRTATAMFLFAFMMSVSFVPLYMKELSGAKNLFGISNEIMLSLPVSVEMFCALGSVLLSGIWLDRRGWCEPFAMGLVLCAIATLLSGLTSSPLIFICSRGLAGLGYGFTWMSAQGYIISDPDAKNRASALSSLVAGIFIGLICGNAVGAMLAGRLGFPAVFKLSSAFMLLPLGFVFVFMRNQYRQVPVKIISSESISFRKLLVFFGDRRVLVTLLFSVIPISLCQLGLVQFAAPVYLDSIGISQANIGRAIMVYGIMLVYVAPLLSRFVDRSKKHRLFIFCGGLIGAAGLIQINMFSGYTTIFIAIALMGLAASFSLSAQSVFILGSARDREISPIIAASIQRTVTKLGQMLGPMILGILFVTFKIEKGLEIMGIYFALTTVVFLVWTAGSTKEAVLEKSEEQQG